MLHLGLLVTCCSIVQLASVCAAAGSGNLLPNASFELGFGERMPTHWHDYQNRFTLKLLVAGQVPSGQPSIESQQEAPDGRHAVRLPVTPDAPAHLPSPVIAIRPAQAYTLSIYARSEDPSARIQLNKWTRSMDFEQPPDAFSPQFALSDEWRRYEFSYVVEEFMRWGVVDIVATSEAATDVWVDAVQLEEGAVASPFVTRMPVEGVLLGRRNEVALHFLNEPLEVHAVLYNQTNPPACRRSAGDRWHDSEADKTCRPTHRTRRSAACGK